MDQSTILVSKSEYDDLIRVANEYYERAIRAEAEAKVLREWVEYLKREHSECGKCVK